MKESESENDSTLNIGSMHGNLLSELWYESDDHVTKQTASDRQQNVRWQGLFQVSAWHDRSYIAGILLLAHGLTVKLSPCPVVQLDE